MCAAITKIPQFLNERGLLKIPSAMYEFYLQYDFNSEGSVEAPTDVP